jgi:hypothetical protein
LELPEPDFLRELARPLHSSRYNWLNPTRIRVIGVNIDVIEALSVQMCAQFSHDFLGVLIRHEAKLNL